MLNRESFVRQLNQSRQVKQVEVPEMGDVAHLRMLSGAERERLEMAVIADREKNLPNQRARLVQATLCDEQGQQIFPFEADIPTINGMPWPVLKRLADEANDFNGTLGVGAKDAEKKSEIPPSPSSSSSSPTGSDASSPSLLSGSPLPS